MVKKRKAIVSWDQTAFLSLQMAFEFISKDSVSNAEKVRDTILKIIRGLPNNPEQFPPDKVKENNKGNYRVREIFISDSLSGLCKGNHDIENSARQTGT